MTRTSKRERPGTGKGRGQANALLQAAVGDGLADVRFQFAEPTMISCASGRRDAALRKASISRRAPFDTTAGRRSEDEGIVRNAETGARRSLPCRAAAGDAVDNDGQLRAGMPSDAHGRFVVGDADQVIGEELARMVSMLPKISRPALPSVGSMVRNACGV